MIPDDEREHSDCRAFDRSSLLYRYHERRRCQECCWLDLHDEINDWRFWLLWLRPDEVSMKEKYSLTPKGQAYIDGLIASGRLYRPPAWKRCLGIRHLRALWSLCTSALPYVIHRHKSFRFALLLIKPIREDTELLQR